MERFERDHLRAVASPREGFECALLTLIDGLNKYAQAHLDQYGSPIGEDYVLGDYWEDIAHGINGLLTGERGRLDGGTLNGIILKALKGAGLPEEKGWK